VTDKPGELARGSTRRVFNLAREGFIIETEWYWRIVDGAGVFSARTAARDLLHPLAWFARDRFTIDAIAIDPDDEGVRFAVAGVPGAVRLEPGFDRLRVDRFVIGLNRVLAAAEVGQTFVLAVPRRYELRGILVPDSERALVAGDPWLLAPANRSDWR
jgi:hypothetical protein